MSDMRATSTSKENQKSNKAPGGAKCMYWSTNREVLLPRKESTDIGAFNDKDQMPRSVFDLGNLQ
eukprot:2284910-Amphidinium_carterae.1